MKKSITSLALLMSAANANAFPGPIPTSGVTASPVEAASAPTEVATAEPEETTYCLAIRNTARDGSLSVGDCDLKRRNSMDGRRLLKNGCAKNQVAVKAYNLKIMSCPVPIQL